jgi:ferric-dicitrate binding protein FerR (iron transport regulator)
MNDLLEKYVKGTCTKEEFALVVEKLQSKNLSSEILHWMKQHWYDLETAPLKIDPSVDFDALLNKIHHDVNLQEAAQRRGRSLKLRSLYVWFQVAAALIVIAISSLGIWYAGTSGLFQDETFYTVASVRGQSSKVTLADGSEVWLNGESTVVYSSKFGHGNRDIQLMGEGFFNVKKNGSLPFVVQVGEARITALGTSFNVDAYHGVENLVVTLESGKVLLESDLESTEIVPGQQAVLRKGKVSMNDVDTELYTSWRNGKIVFKNETLWTITSQLEKMYDVKFVFKADTLKDFRYRGTLRLDNSILKALEMLKISTGIVFEVEGNMVVLKEK